MEPKEDNILSQKFIKPNKYIVDKLMIQRMIIMALAMSIGTLYLFSYYALIDISKAWTISLTTLAVFQWFNAWNCRSNSESIFKLNPFKNKFLVGGTLIVITLQILAVYTPFLQKILHTVPLSLFDWTSIILVAFSIVIFEEIRKMYYNLVHARK
jgi:Ca2+-transporting ATPase